MGLFDKVMGAVSGVDAPFSKEEAFFAIAIAIVAADGEISSEELDDVIRMVQRKQLFQKLPSSDFKAMVDKVFKFLKKNGSPALVKKGIEFLPAELRDTAFAVSVDLVFADGSVEDEEKDLIDQLQAGMGISDQMAMKIVEVMEIKNRG